MLIIFVDFTDGIYHKFWYQINKFKKQLLFVIAVAFDLHSFANSQDEVLLLSNDIHTEKALEYMRYSFQVVML